MTNFSVQNKYKPVEPWDTYDFAINNIFWSFQDKRKARLIRLENLVDLCSILKKNKIQHWLFGRTLLGAYKYGDFLDDHDDDIGINLCSLQELLNIFTNYLQPLGFTIIRRTDHIVSLQRNYRYIDICLFSAINNHQISYGYKIMPKHHFDNLSFSVIDEHIFTVPTSAEKLLNYLYPKNKYHRCLQTLTRKMRYLSNNNIIKITRIKILNKWIFLAEKSLVPRWLINLLYPVTGVSAQIINLQTFLELDIEPINSFNWKWRCRHLALITNNNVLSKIKNIRDHLRKPGIIDQIEASVVDSTFEFGVDQRLNLDERFWWSGNNYFWYCIKYQFRKNVLPYASAYSYISTHQKPDLFSAQYYESLPVMCDQEIASFLQKNPITVQNNAIISGKHRAFAMIGRLQSGLSYIPLNAVSIESGYLN